VPRNQPARTRVPLHPAAPTAAYGLFVSLMFVTPSMPGTADNESLVATPETAGGTDREAATWLAAARRGDLAAFARLVRLHQARVFSVALRLCRQREDAQEIAQDAFVQLHGALEGISSPAHLKHWLLCTVTHRAIDRLRQSARRPRLATLDGIPDVAAPEQETPDPLVHRRLRAAIATLAPDARAVLLLRYQEDLDPLEISRVLAMPHNTVKSHLRRALEQLRTTDWSDA
jgi:RNA polymerase sigma-70 factor, ECF subfamily